jgi:dissimilatory sulfite reductase related protein
VSVSTKTIAGMQVDLNEEGFFLDPAQWSDEVGVEIAKEAGIDPMTDRHWQVVRYMRQQYLDTGTAPSIRALGKASGVPVKELYQLFPKGPAKLAAKIAGIPKPRGCI